MFEMMILLGFVFFVAAVHSVFRYGRTGHRTPLLIAMFLVCCAVLCFASTSSAAEAEVTVVVIPGPDPAPDIQHVRIFAGLSPESLEQVEEFLWNPNTGDPVPESTHVFVVQDNAETPYFFGAKFVDTSGNVSDMSPLHEVSFDFLPPAPPEGVSVTFRVVAQ